MVFPRNWTPLHNAVAGVGAAVLAVFLAAAAGCGTGAYDAKLHESVKRLKTASGFSVLLPPEEAVTDVPGIKSIRLPTAFTGVSGWDAPPDKDDSLHRFQPALFKPKDDEKRKKILALWGHKRTYETVLDSGQSGQRRIYCYLGVVPTAKKTSGELATELREQLTISEIGPWQDIVLRTPQEGRTIQLRRLEIIDDYPFFDGKRGTTKKRGIFQVYLHSNEHYNILVGWLISFTDGDMPETCRHELEKIARPCVATLEVTPEPPAPKHEDL